MTIVKAHRLFAAACIAGTHLVAAAAAQDRPSSNACPVDGCKAGIVSAVKVADELLIRFEANFLPDISRNHLHVWWGELYDVAQVSNDAETRHGVAQGDWHPTDSYPEYTTHSAASTTVRKGATTLCVSPADRNHDILDVKIFDCRSVANLLD